VPARDSRPALTRGARRHPAVVTPPVIESASPAVLKPVADARVQIKFRAGRDLRRRLRLAAATMERTQDEILAEALDAWLARHGAGG